MPFGLDTKSIVIGAVIGYLVLPRIVGPVVGKAQELMSGGGSE